MNELPPLPEAEAWSTHTGPMFDRSTEYAYTANQMRAYAAAAVAAEREACAKVCEGRIGGATQLNDWWYGFRGAVKQCAAAIRARK